jgi:bifunctional non-homologous end joining protein LigD
MFRAPMLASICPDSVEVQPGQFMVEEKYDGERIGVLVSSGHDDLFTAKRITAWSRYGLERKLPTHLTQELAQLPDGYYDGELMVPGARSYGVKVLTNAALLQYFIFDALQLKGVEIMTMPYHERRQRLLENIPDGNAVHLADSFYVGSWDDIISHRDAVWARGGEGLILKRITAPYLIGKRSKDWMKIKDLRHAILTVTGFVAGQSVKQNRGPFAMVRLQDDDGNVITVKTKNDYELRRLESESRQNPHPRIGTKLVILYQERTPDGSYRHPRWDRWATE